MAKKKTPRAPAADTNRPTKKSRPAKKAAAKKTSGVDKKKGATRGLSPAAAAAELLNSKLDPLLLAGAMRADLETRLVRPSAATETAMAALAPKPGRVTRGGTPTADDGPTAAPTRNYGIRSLATQLAPKSLERLIEDDMVPVLVDAHDRQKAIAEIRNLSADVSELGDSTLLASVPRTRLRDVAQLDAVKYVEASVKLRPNSDLAHRSSRLIIAPATTRSVPQTGKGVLIGVIDTGIDAAHPAFKSGTKTRIVSYIDQTPTGADKVYTPTQIDAGAASASPDTIGHGTHVAGIAAGNGQGSPAGMALAGVATEADLAIVKTTFDSGDIAQGIRKIFQLADQRNQPCVVNLSLGGHFGGHDGTTVTERTIDQLSGPGRLVVVSAGNEGRDATHASTVLPRGQTTPATWTTNFKLNRQQLQAGVFGGQLFVQVWQQREDSLTIRLRAPNGEFISAPANGVATVDRTVFLVQAGHQIAPYSGDSVTTFTVITADKPEWLNGWSIVVNEERTPGKPGVEVGAVHAWIADGDMGSFTSGMAASYLVGMPGSAYSAITVASYATRKSWNSSDPSLPTVTLDAVNLEDISYFSSMGPARDGDTKPEICAPGQWLLAPLSSAASTDEIPAWLRLPGGKYAAMQGTSMSAPYVTGALALLLQKNPKIDWAEVKRRLIKSARQDGKTTTCWNPRWGFGKIDVQRLLTIEP
jgi:subtilisin family serine protease